MSARSFYQSLLSEFTRRAQNSKFKVSQGSLKTVDNEVWLEGGLKMAATASSCRGLGKNANLYSIYIMPRERFKDHKTLLIEGSQVEVAYVKREDAASRKAKIVMGLHYDFDVDAATGNPKDLHPIFHAQVSRKLIRLNGIMNSDHELDAQGDEWPAFRVPTAHISLTSCLLGISADHFTSSEHAGFLGWVRKREVPFPRMENDLLIARLNGCGMALRSCAWYS